MHVPGLLPFKKQNKTILLLRLPQLPVNSDV
jgi:hypothetical protein